MAAAPGSGPERFDVDDEVPQSIPETTECIELGMKLPDAVRDGRTDYIKMVYAKCGPSTIQRWPKLLSQAFFYNQPDAFRLLFHCGLGLKTLKSSDPLTQTMVLNGRIKFLRTIHQNGGGDMIFGLIPDFPGRFMFDLCLFNWPVQVQRSHWDTPIERAQSIGSTLIFYLACGARYTQTRVFKKRVGWYPETNEEQRRCKEILKEASAFFDQAVEDKNRILTAFKASELRPEYQLATLMEILRGSFDEDLQEPEKVAALRAYATARAGVFDAERFRAHLRAQIEEAARQNPEVGPRDDLSFQAFMQDLSEYDEDLYRLAASLTRFSNVIPAIEGPEPTTDMRRWKELTLVPESNTLLASFGMRLGPGFTRQTFMTLPKRMRAAVAAVIHCASRMNKNPASPKLPPEVWELCLQNMLRALYPRFASESSGSGALALTLRQAFLDLC